MKTSVFLVLFLMGCQGGTLPKYYELNTLRVVALVADNPEISTAGSATITPILSDIQGGGRALTFVAVSCVDPGVGYGATPSCDGNATRVVLGQGAVAGLTAPNYTGAVGTLNVSPVAGMLVGRSAADQNNGVAMLVTYTVTAADGESVRAFRRVVVSTRATKNTNPSLTDILAGGVALAALPTSAVSLSPSVAGGAQESYDFMRADGSISSTQEALQVSWLVSDGKMEFSRSETSQTNKFTPPGSAPAGRNVIVIGVLRDNRGGVSFVQKTL